jgi:hypothetical protein
MKILILAKNSSSTISTGGAQVVALMLAEADKKNVPMLIDILWNCIQNSKDKTEIVNQLSTLTSITSINSGKIAPFPNFTPTLISTRP